MTRARAVFGRDAPTSVRVRIVLTIGVLLVSGTFLLDMSGSAARTAGSDRVQAQHFSAIVPAGGTVCQPVSPLPADATRASVLIGTYYRPLPPVSLRFLDVAGSTVALGGVQGGHQGYVVLPLRRSPGASPAATACLHVGGAFRVAIGGTGVARGSPRERVDGKPQPGLITILYLRRGQESWWQLLPVLDLRFGLGKAAFFGRWALPAVALLVLLLWIGTIRFLAREIR